MKIGGLEKSSLLDYPNKIAAIVYTVGCNFRCPYCHNPELVDETTDVQISTKQILDFLKTRQGLLDGVVITGGEPTIHPGLPDFLASIKKLGFLIKLDTNGTNPKLLKKLMNKKLIDYLAMDIKSPFNKYSQTVARPTDVAAIKESISLIMSSDIDYEFRTTIVKTQLSIKDLIEIGKAISGAQNYYLQKFVPTKILNPQFISKTSYTDEELEKVRGELLKEVQNCEIR